MTAAPRPRSPQPKELDAGILRAEISSFALRLAAQGNAAKTIRTYAEAVQWFATGTVAITQGHLLHDAESPPAAPIA